MGKEEQLGRKNNGEGEGGITRKSKLGIRECVKKIEMAYKGKIRSADLVQICISL